MLHYISSLSSSGKIKLNLWYIPVVPTGKPDFGAANCPVRELRYYHRYMTELQELKKGKSRLCIPFKDNNAASISHWICTTIVDSHATLQNSKSIPGKFKAHEVRAVATSIKSFNKVDLQAVMKAGRWSRGCTFTSFYLRGLCPQTGPVRLAAGEIIEISS